MNSETLHIIRSVLLRHRVTRAGVFGSFARNEESAESDVDLLVEVSPDVTLLDFIAIKLDLEQALSRGVDLVEYSTVKPTIRDRILFEEVPIV
jgi:uncharacterized protein